LVPGAVLCDGGVAEVADAGVGGVDCGGDGSVLAGGGDRMQVAVGGQAPARRAEPVFQPVVPGLHGEQGILRPLRRAAGFPSAMSPSWRSVSTSVAMRRESVDATGVASQFIPWTVVAEELFASLSAKPKIWQ